MAGGNVHRGLVPVAPAPQALTDPDARNTGDRQCRRSAQTDSCRLIPELSWHVDAP